MSSPKSYAVKQDVHHLCWPKKKWCRGYLKALRDHWYLKVTIPKQTLHAKIHHLIKGIPLPSGWAAKEAYKQIVNLEHYSAIHNYDTVEKRLELLISLFSCCSQPTADALTEELNIVRKFYNRPQK